MMAPRAYQSEAAEQAWAVVASGGRPVIDLPTGSGKSLVAAILARGAYEDGESTIVVTHRRELIRQNQEQMTRYDTELGMASRVYCAGLKDKSLDAAVTFASVDSLVSAKNAPHLENQLKHVGLLVIDEAHRVSESGRYNTLLSSLPETCAVIGMTATPFRGDGVGLTEGEGRWFTHVVEGVSYRKLVYDQHLVPLRNIRNNASVNLSGVSMVQSTGGGKDFHVTESEDRVQAALEPVLQEAFGRWLVLDKPATLVFVRTIDTAYKARDILRGYGVRSDALDASTPLVERDRVLSAFKGGHTDFLCSVDTISTGFDAPIAGLGVYLRPTASPVWHVQALGRLTRPHPGKTEAHVLDFVGNLLRCGPVDDPVLKEHREKVEGEAPCKQCPCCNAVVHAAYMTCPECGHHWERPPLPNEVKQSGYRGNASTLESSKDVYLVSGVRAMAHKTRKGPVAIRLVWDLMDEHEVRRRVQEYVNCNAAHPYAQSKGAKRMQELGGSAGEVGDWRAQLTSLDSPHAASPSRVRVTEDRQGFPRVAILESGHQGIQVDYTDPHAKVW